MVILFSGESRLGVGSLTGQTGHERSRASSLSPPSSAVIQSVHVATITTATNYNYSSRSRVLSRVSIKLFSHPPGWASRGVPQSDQRARDWDPERSAQPTLCRCIPRGSTASDCTFYSRVVFFVQLDYRFCNEEVVFLLFGFGP